MALGSAAFSAVNRALTADLAPRRGGTPHALVGLHGFLDPLSRLT
jgi:hypothetical protein